MKTIFKPLTNRIIHARVIYPMKIAMIGQKGMPASFGGVEQHVQGLSKHLVKAGHQVAVYNRGWYTKNREGNIDGVETINIPSIHTKHFDTITHVLASSLHAVFQKYDVIHYHGVGPSLLSWIPRIFAPKTKVVTTFHSIDRYHKKWGLFARIVLHIGEWSACTFAHETITISRSLERYCLKEFDKQTHCIPNAVKPSKLDSGSTLIKEFGLKKGKYITMISRLIPHKGAHLLVEAFCNLKREYKDDLEIKNLKLAIVGGSVYTDEYVSSLQKQAGICNDIIFTDFQSGEILKELYSNAMALVHPSMNEGLPITVLDAMNYGTPALVSNIAEHLELIKDSRMIFTENNVNDIVRAIYEFMQISKEEKETIIEQNRKTIQVEYSWDSTIPKIIKLYQNIKPVKLKSLKTRHQDI